MTTTFTFPPHIDPVGQINYRVRSARFGDGYSQSVADGINNRVSTWPLTFVVKDAVADQIIAFLDARMGYQSFYWTPPRDTQKLFQCVGFTHTAHGGGWHTIAATFEQVFRV